MNTLKQRINNTDDKWDRRFGMHFLKTQKGKTTLVTGQKYKVDIQDYYSNYGVDVEKASYDPMERANPISIPFRKQKLGGYWVDGRETDYIQFVKDNSKLIFISSDTIKKYKDNPVQRGNIELPYSLNQRGGYYGYTLEESKQIWNSYIEIPKTEVEVWVRSGSKRNWKWNKI